jgi:hypothetical protein
VSKSDNLKELPGAFIALQKDLEPIKKDTEGVHKVKYATLAAVMKAIQPHLSAHDFVLFHTMRDGGANSARMETVLMHKSAEYISSTIEVPFAKPNDPQAYGSAMTYGRRYSIMALLGLVTDDDDAQSASITLEDRLRDIFEAKTVEELGSAGFKHENQAGLTLVERKAIRAALKVMGDVVKEPA